MVFPKDARNLWLAVEMASMKGEDQESRVVGAECWRL